MALSSSFQIPLHFSPLFPPPLPLTTARKLSLLRCSSSSSPGNDSRTDPPPPPKKVLSDQSSWEAKDSEGNDYLYRLGKEADNMNIAVGARAGVIDDLFAGKFLGRDSDIVFDYRQKVTRSFEYLQGDYYIAPIFLNYIAHLLNIKIPLILGIWGGKGQGKSFQTELVFQAMGIEPIIMSAGELESERAGEPGRLIRERYRTASQVVQNQPNREDIVNIVHRMYEKDGIPKDDVVRIVDEFPNQALDFYGALRSRTYDRSISKWIDEIGGVQKSGTNFSEEKRMKNFLYSLHQR
ncbi:ribulose bisphosphate carboxylase/oxygenase activase [Quercus suber]|uniref:Ribulose bisphosphate carboxylase/oxygenase activase n=1 Tax=Quercus suber TaxID=58331 RepID=A0AAW0J332_QUESU